MEPLYECLDCLFLLSDVVALSNIKSVSPPGQLTRYYFTVAIKGAAQFEVGEHKGSSLDVVCAAWSKIRQDWKALRDAGAAVGDDME